MSKKEKPFNILIIDDDKKYVETLQLAARRPQFRMILNHCMNLEEAKQLLTTNKGRNIAGVILDVVCLKSLDQTVPDNSFIIEALDFFNSKYPYLPKAVLTGDPGQYKNLKALFKDKHKTYAKGQEEDELLEYLKDKASQLDFIKIAAAYPNVFEVFEKEYLDADARDKLISCIKEMNKSDRTGIADNLTRLRSLVEKIFISINRIKPDLVPTEFFTDKNSTYGDRVFHLANNGHIHQYGITFNSLFAIHGIASKQGAHEPKETPDYWATKYTVQSLVFALFDLLLWFKGIMDDANQGN